MRNGSERETVLVSRALFQLDRALPPTWQTQLIDMDFDDLGGPDVGVDARLDVRPPRGPTYRFAVQVKARLSTGAKEAVGRARVIHEHPLPALLVTEYATPALRRYCEDLGISYVDATGWLYLRDEHGLLVRSAGAEKAPVDPDRRRNEISRLDGRGASRVVRTLWDAVMPIGVRELGIVAAVSPGTVAKVLPALEKYGALARDESGRIVRLDRRLLIERWIQDYRFRSSNTETALFVAPRGPERAADRLMDSPLPVALTGYHAARAYLPESTVAVVPPTELVVYCAEPDVLAKQLVLLPATPRSANVTIVVPKDGELLRNGVTAVPAPQVIADLLTMGGRYPELGIQVFESLTNQPWGD